MSAWIMIVLLLTVRQDNTLNTILMPSTPIPDPPNLYEIVMMQRDVRAGDLLTADSIALQPAPYFPYTAFRDVNEVMGQRAARDLYAGEYVVPLMLVPSTDRAYEPLTRPGESARRFPVKFYGQTNEGHLDDGHGWDEWEIVLPNTQTDVSFIVERIEGDLQPVVLVWSADDEVWLMGDYRTDPGAGRAERRATVQASHYIVAVTHQGETSGRYRLVIQ